MAANPHPPAAAPVSAKMRLYQWAVQKATGFNSPERIRISDILEEARREFMSDPAWVHRFCDEILDEIVRSVITQAVASTRGHRKRYIFKDTVMAAEVYAQQTTAEASALSASLMQKWMNWREHTGNGHVRLLDMTRQDLIKAAELRERRAQRDLELAALWRAIADRLPDDDSAVREHLNAFDIEALDLKIRQEGGTFTDPEITPAQEADRS